MVKGRKQKNRSYTQNAAHRRILDTKILKLKWKLGGIVQPFHVVDGKDAVRVPPYAAPHLL